MTLEDVSKSSGWTDLDALEKKLHEMGVVGLIEWNWENDAHIKQYILPLFVPGAAEFLNMRKEVVDEHPEVCDFFNAMTTLPSRKSRPWSPSAARASACTLSLSRRPFPPATQVRQH